MPFHFEPVSPAPHNKNIIYGYVGGGREEQGVGLLAPLVAEYIKRGGKGKFIFQIGFTVKTEKAVSFKNELRHVAEKFSNQVKLMPYIITGDGYKDLFRQFNCILLPYAAENYHSNRPSQILQESIAQGIPSLVCRGSSLAYEVSKAANGGLILDNLDIPALCDALFAFEADAAVRMEKARVAAERYRAYNNIEMFMKIILHTGRAGAAVQGNAGDTASWPGEASETNTPAYSSIEHLHEKKYAQARANPKRPPGRRFWAGIFSRTRAYLKLRGSPLFQAQYYLAHNGDVRNSRMDPLRHFLLYGWKEDRKPNPFFDPAYYLAAHHDVKMAGVNPLCHYLEHGWKERRNPSPLFDAWAYLAANEDVLRANMEALTHYLRHGLLEGRNLV